MKGATPAANMLELHGIHYFLHSYDHKERELSYGTEAATALGLDPRQIFKTLIAAVDSGLVCAVVPVAGRLDLKALAVAADGKKAEMADPVKAQRATGYVLGGISPLGHRVPMPVIVDISATSLSSMYVSAGKRGLQLELAPTDLIRLANATVAPIATN